MPFNPHSPLAPQALLGRPQTDGQQVNGQAAAFSGCQQCHGSKIGLRSTAGGMITVDDLQPDADGHRPRATSGSRPARYRGDSGPARAPLVHGRGRGTHRAHSAPDAPALRPGRTGQRRRLSAALNSRPSPYAGAVLPTTSTGQGACRTTRSATLPSSTWLNPVRPCEPTTIRSLLDCSAILQIS